MASLQRVMNKSEGVPREMRLQKNKCHLVPADFLEASVGLLWAYVKNLVESSRRKTAHGGLTLPSGRQVMFPLSPMDSIRMPQSRPGDETLPWTRQRDSRTECACF